MRRARIWARSIGQTVQTLDTPVALVDLDAVDDNNTRMAALCREAGVKWRAHAKMHKSSHFALMSIVAGSTGVCAQKVGECEALVDGGVRDVHVSNVVLAPAKLERLAAVAERALVSVCVDSLVGVERVAHAVRARPAAAASLRVLVEVDCGHGRCGCAPEEAVPLAHAILEHGLAWGGIQCYHGAIQHQRSHAQRAEAATQVAATARVVRDALVAAVGSCPTVTGGGSGTLFADLRHTDVWTELQPGSFLFGDVDYAANEWAQGQWPWRQALVVQSAVVSHGPDRSVLDAGNKSHSLDAGVGPRVLGHPEWQWHNGGDEHGILRGPGLPERDTVVQLIPGHIDPTVAMWDHVVGHRKGVVECVIAIDARDRAD